MEKLYDFTGVSSEEAITTVMCCHLFKHLETREIYEVYALLLTTWRPYDGQRFG
jgi:hypothetical protein